MDVVVEMIGGLAGAKDVVFAAIRAGKHVVMANKELSLVTKFGPKLSGTA
ncbi:hypothetical protein LLE49_23135 [Alicyclobacillus tolerans]|nr:hypothetical protein [Alicyclobacillus tolerans]MCF8567617.1 hypothetical protein [Alicyclobacillus tolerans]